ncbi:MAG: response regulator [Alphaproteobacteria bacterium]|nr:response regulator [Alphaproteobacteria bacterium SS10]
MNKTDLTSKQGPDPNKPTDSGDYQPLVLVVDDDGMVGSMTGHCLRRSGYRTQIFDDPKEALEWFGENAAAVDLLISDQNMPGLVGTDLAVAIRKKKRNLPVIICSGYVDAIDPKVTENGLIAQLLSKPTPTHVLLSAVKNVLAKKA